MVVWRVAPCQTHAAANQLTQPVGNALTYDWLSLTAESAAAHPVFALR
jgi:hypothetical protein